jgi:hypothetical protein
MVGVVILAPLGLGIAGLGLILGFASAGGTTAARSSTAADNSPWPVVLFVVAGLVLLWWLACMVKVVMTLVRGRDAAEGDDEAVPRARVHER